jgi:hypothetical protein
MRKGTLRKKAPRIPEGKKSVPWKPPLSCIPDEEGSTAGDVRGMLVQSISRFIREVEYCKLLI